MSCPACGHKAEVVNGETVQPHNLGCHRSIAARRTEVVVTTDEQLAKLNECEHGGCSKPKKPWSGKGARPKYCAEGHKKEK